MIAEALGVSAGAAGLLAYAVGGRSARLLAPGIHRGPRDRPAIALTFDDGPSERTPELLELLDRYGARATFFQCGANARRLPEIARAVAAAGHDVGNHGYSHTRLFLRTPAFILDEMARAQEAIAEATGVAPRLFRAPYGGRWFGMRRAQARLGLTGVMWTRIGNDWKWPAERVVRHLVDGAFHGAIFCLHDGRNAQTAADVRNTIEAVRRLLEELPGRGLRCEPVSAWLCKPASDHTIVR